MRRTTLLRKEKCMSALPTSFYWLCSIGGVSWILLLISFLNWKSIEKEKKSARLRVIESHEGTFDGWFGEYGGYCDLLGRSQFWTRIMTFSLVGAIVCSLGVLGILMQHHIHP